MNIQQQKKRILEAVNLGIESLIVSCPICLVMLEDARKSLALKYKLDVVDISRFILKFA